MKKGAKGIAAVLGALLALGFCVSVAEKRREKERENPGGKIHRPYGFYEAWLKRPFDFAAAAGLLVLLSPVYAAVAAAVRVKLGRPVIFTQERPGKDGRIFKLYKFRTMTDERDEKGKLLADGERLPEFGRRLRATSLDELPELLNILRGEMSLVGPRPLLKEYLGLYSERQARRHEVLPGLTGLAQVNGRNELSWEEKFEWDVRYVDSITFPGDLRILARTAAAVLKHRGIHSRTSATMEYFQGDGK